jgi:hypothetical protein
MSAIYFSDREFGAKAREAQQITPAAWQGIVGAIETRIDAGAFGLDFPERCNDGSAWIVGTDRTTFSQVLQGEIPDLEWPLRTATATRSDFFGSSTAEPYAPETALALDLIEFCYRHVAEPGEDGLVHSHFGHHHLEFNRELGQENLRLQINRIFARNGLAYELRADGTVERLAPPVLRENLRSVIFNTGDDRLDDLLEVAREKFLSHDANARRESLEKLWDAWERLKTLDNPADKKLSIQTLLDNATAEQSFREALEQEARELTRIGNAFQIRHSEIGKAPIEDNSQVDYLFHRLFALMYLILDKRSSTEG